MIEFLNKIFRFFIISNTCGPYYSGHYFAGSPKIGECDCKNKPWKACRNPFRTVHGIEYSGGQLHDPQFLDEHIKASHPRLVKRLQPKLPCSTSKNDGSKLGLQTRQGSAYGTFCPT
ncbi:hypothetical protein KC19_VG085300 [Ceratodon purpureus]|uniref:Uncharacterized protein n=1 Tax=Ceratodon purpureus TaxID=3225 RepID=A0A8T0HNB5_CERPU|nr:hypothetical protein KC19_VG085300 [Ceratodon purpureus]